MHWLIAEDCLENRHGHWLEYLMGFQKELPTLGDSVTWLLSHRASPEIIRQFDGYPLLPECVFKKMSLREPIWRRFLRIPTHAWKTFLSLRSFLRTAVRYDIIFVPTVILHHLLGWFFVIKFLLRKNDTRVLLFFPGLPLLMENGIAEMDGSPSSRFFSLLLKGLKREIESGKVILGVETVAMKRAAELIFGVPFTYFPHPVPPLNVQRKKSETMIIACYGAARHEKGSDLFIEAIAQYLTYYPESRVKFVIQWIEDFSKPDGSIATIPETLRNHSRVEVLRTHFDAGEYSARLAQTDLLVLPYRISSYALRVSRVVIEALVNSIPVVVTEGTTLADQSQDGGGIRCRDGDVDSLVVAIRRAVLESNSLASRANESARSFQMHYSVERFRSILS